VKQTIDQMSDLEKRRALEHLLKAQIAKQGIYPLSDAQLGMWLQQNLEPTSSAYNIPLAFCLHGRMRDPLRLVRQSLIEVVNRHSTLRTVFRVADDQPEQHVLASVQVELAMRELRVPTHEDWQSIIPALTRRQANSSFDLTTGPLFRFELLELSEELHVLLATFHHIIMDGWSIGVFLTDFAKACIAHSRRIPLVFDPMPHSYRHFVLAQQRSDSREQARRHLDYWERRLLDAPSSINLPVKYRPTSDKSFAGATHSFTIPSDVVQRLSRLGQLNGATDFMTMLATFFVLLARLCDQDDLVLGVSVANRDEKACRNVVGLFSDVLPMRGKPSPNTSFSQFLQETRAQCLADYDHAKVPLFAIIERVKPARHTNRNLLFQAGFDFQNTPWFTVDDYAVPLRKDVEITLINGDSGSSKLDLNLNLSKVRDTLVAVFEYDLNLFSIHDIHCMERCYRSLLDSIVEFPHLALDRLNLLADAERRKVLDRFSGADIAEQTSVEETSVIAQLRARVALDPDYVALEDGAIQVSYRELDAWSSSLARALAASGVRPGDRVGLCFERGAAYVAALLGVGKAGGCYVPIDPQMTGSRRDYVIADARIGVMMTSRSLSQRLAREVRLPLVVMEDVDTHHEAGGAELEPSASQAAYIIYTSGSTGEPKGVVVCHGALAKFVRVAATQFAHVAEDRVLQLASISFDTSAEEIFPALAVGATLVFADGDLAGSPERLLEGCALRRISVINLPTALWHEVVDTLDPAGVEVPHTTRLVIIGGEAASPKSLARWLDCVKQRVRLLNTYGPTETIVSVTAAELSATLDVDRIRSVSIGRPYPGVRVYILDRHGTPQPPGVFGQIAIGGHAISEGYNGAPELTAEKFVVDPFAQSNGARMFLSGDFGRFLDDGSIEFAGRRDNQIKVRGFRVELGEIESALLHCPGVAQGAVVLRDGPNQQVAAFVVAAASGDKLLHGDVRAWMQGQLPSHMQPSAYEILPSLPTTVSGKIDRAALVATAIGSISASTDRRSPSTHEEDLLVEIWADTLGLPQVGTDENFFQLGGHSLLLMRMLSRVRRVFGLDISLAKAFEVPTVAGLASLIVDMREQLPTTTGTKIEIASRSDAASQPSVFRQSFAQQRLWFLDRLSPGSSAYNNPSVMRVDGELDIDLLQASIDVVVDRHEVLRTVFADGQDGYPVQIVRASGSIQLALIDLTLLDEEVRHQQLVELVSRDAQGSFDLQRGPLLRLTVARCSVRSHALLFNWHHIITDAGSLAVFIGELGETYRALTENRPSRLATPTLQYADFANWEQQNLHDAVLTGEIAYWKGKLAGASLALALPRHAGAARGTLGLCERINLRISGQTAAALMDLAKANKCTLFIVCLAAFKLLLSRHAGEADIVVATPISGRFRQELEPIIGFFINTLAMRTDLTTAGSFLEVLELVRITAMDAYANQQVPIERLARDISWKNVGVTAALFDVSFVLENRVRSIDVFPGTTVTPLRRGLQDAKFPLSLSMREVEDGIDCEWEWARDVFDDSAIRDMTVHFGTLLDNIATGPGKPLGQLSMCDIAQQRQILDFWCDGGVQLDEAGCLHEQFEEQVVRQPDAIAIVYADEQLSYAQLNSRANQLAHYLRAQGVRANSLVAVCMERSLWLAVAIMAVWKAGGAYVPLDPAYPAARLAEILDDAGAVLLLGHGHLIDHFAACDLPMLAIDSDAFGHVLRAQPTADFDRSACAPATGNLAYAIFTSGSTGRPKGVLVEHRSLANLGQNLRMRLSLAGIADPGRWAWNASASFDASMQALSQWAYGATLYLLDETLRRDPAGLISYLGRQRIDVLDTTPMQVDVLLQAAVAGDRLPMLVIGGEAIEEHLWGRIVEHCSSGGGPALNVYGPTEATVDATAAWIEPGRPTIGRPLKNVRCHVLDVHGQLQPVGVAGELHIGGAGVARGYANRPELTAERFVALDIDGKRERLYRTGDIVRWLANGDLQFVGRSDGQVKHRGYRVELGEIEHRLRSVAGVATAVATLRGDAGWSRELVAYVVPQPDFSSAPEWVDSLRQSLQLSLPAYMVPERFVVLDALPLTVSGKLDHAMLPVPGGENSAVTHVAPENVIERKLVQIWAELFNVQADTVSVEANFFSMGGNSLQLMRLMTAIRNSFAVPVTLKSLFDAHSLRVMAALLETALSRGGEQMDGGLPMPVLEETEW
jgi:amino acid adenylation domain-containing protein